MFVSEELIYIQMPKTACTHIAVLLSQMFEGKSLGKHKAPTEAQLTSKKYFVSSIRNPWEWYLSLWTYGATGTGSVRQRLTTRAPRRFLKPAIKRPLHGGRALLRELIKDVDMWQRLYEDADDVESFRVWLKRIHNPHYSGLLQEGYGETSVSEFCGFMTYRYLRLCCMNRHEIYGKNSLICYDDVVQFDKQNCRIDYFIRQESVEDDLCRLLEYMNVLTTERRKLVVNAKRINESNRRRRVADYFDRETMDLVYERDRLLIEKFGYSPPASDVDLDGTGRNGPSAFT